MSYNLKYYFTFYADRDTRIIDGTPDDYTCNISQLDYAGSEIEILAQENPIQINYQNTSSNKLEPIIGSECTLNLIANEDLELQDLYTENEREFLVEVYRNGSLIWSGFIIPDGCQEAFTFAPYVISVNAVDGLGLLKNLSYVQNDGNFYLGKQSFIDVINACLIRLDAPSLVLNTCVNIYDVTMTEGDAYDPLAQGYVNAERYLKEDQFTAMNCQEVLYSVLQLFTACIIQSDGEWYIYRPNELALTGDLTFRKYLDGERVYDQPTFTPDLDALLGGESEGVVLAPYFHINTDQMKMIDKPYKNASFSFKYGFVSSLISNPEFSGWNGITFTDWAKSSVFLPLFEDINGGAKLGNYTASPGPYLYIENITPAEITEGDMIIFKMGYYNYISDGPSARVMLTDGLTTWYLDQLGEWGTIDTRINGLTLQYYEEVLSITARRAPITGDLTIRLYEAREDLIPPSPDLFITYKSASIVPNLNTDQAIGELHTSTQRGKFSFVPETINLLNGDSSSNIYLSAIYGPDEVTRTTEWNRRGLTESILAEPFQESKQLIRIASEEKQRLYAGPFVRFEGSIFGYFNPVTRWSINLVTGHFMNLSLNYDLQQNICKAVLGRITNEEIALDYTLTPDYGATTRVTVKGTTP